jgi:hypothetical protein
MFKVCRSHPASEMVHRVTAKTGKREFIANKATQLAVDGSPIPPH